MVHAFSRLPPSRCRRIVFEGVVMRKCLAAILSGLCVVGAIAPLVAATETVTGEVVSLSCYLNDKTQVGKKGYVCALATVKWEGNPAAVLTADGKLYQIAGGLTANNNEKLIPLLGHTVTITGDVAVKAGMPTITADDAKDVARPK
jgi:hypothetical protein